MIFTKILAVASLLQVIALPSGWAWSQHTHVTRAALEKVPYFENAKVRVSTFTDLLKSLKFRGRTFADARAFNESIEIRKEYQFDFKRGEVVGSDLLAIDIVSHYSDEPDWGMDRELFDESQYPNLWRPEFAMMGGRVGTPSQAFRHMYWPKFSLSRPILTFKLPLDKANETMGHAPDRAAVFSELAQAAREAGHEYWAWRFVANGFHYFEDVAQPFHANQTPTKKFILMPFFEAGGSGLKDFVPQMTHIVSYYHFAFEDYIGFLMDQSSQLTGHPEGDLLELALQQKGEGAQIDFMRINGSLGTMVEVMADAATNFSSRAGVASLDFFPPLPGPYATVEPSKIVDHSNKVWWDQVLAKGRESSEVKKEYFSVVSEMFNQLGEGVRIFATQFSDSKK